MEAGDARCAGQALGDCLKASLQEAEEKATQNTKAGSCGALPVRRQGKGPVAFQVAVVKEQGHCPATHELTDNLSGEPPQDPNRTPH